jgi:hypothetical protein
MDDRLLGNHTPQAFTRPIHRFVLFALGISAVLAVLAAAPPASAAGSQFFPQTGHAVSGPFMAYWQDHGGLPIFGYPISDAHNDVDPSSGKTVLVQWFERARFELHPEFAGTPFEVALGLLGNQLAQGRQGQAPFEPVAPFTSTPDRVFFPKTSHALAGSFYAYWATNGGLPIFGYPVSEAFPEANPADGQVYTVQYFERARFEAHPANPPAYQVELGLLGTQLMPPIPASQQVAIRVSGGASQVTIAPDQTALVRPGTTEMAVALQFPQPVDQASIQVQIHQLPGPDAWQLAPTGRMPTRNGYIFGLRGSLSSPPYLLGEVTRGAGQSAIFFGVQLGSDQANPPLFANWNDPVALLNAYYNAINRYEYARAYSYWENPGAPNGVTASFADFANGYANTAVVNLTTGDVTSDAGAGNIFYQVPAVIIARQTDGSTRRFYGCYLLHRANVEMGNTTPPYPIALRAAHIVAAPPDADVAALLEEANALVQAGQCGQ